jgi:hypothetical protein
LLFCDLLLPPMLIDRQFLLEFPIDLGLHASPQLRPALQVSRLSLLESGSDWGLSISHVVSLRVRLGSTLRKMARWVQRLTHGFPLWRLRPVARVQ